MDQWTSQWTSGESVLCCHYCGQTEAFCLFVVVVVVVVVVFHHHHHYYYHLGMALALAVKLDFCLQVVIHLLSVLAADRYVPKCDASRTETADRRLLFWVYLFTALSYSACSRHWSVWPSDRVGTDWLSVQRRGVSWSVSIPWCQLSVGRLLIAC